MVAIIMTFYTFLSTVLEHQMHGLGGLVSAANAGTIVLFNLIYTTVAQMLTDWENHRTEMEYKNSMIIKMIMFQFVNSYFSLYLASFVKPWAVAPHPAGTI